MIHHDQTCLWRLACMFQAHPRQAQEFARPAAYFGEAPGVGIAPKPEGEYQQAASKMSGKPDKPSQATD
jgi:hypothetical protein